MPLPARLSVISCNIWNTQRWPEREPALTAFVRTFNPDILCLQELRAETRDSLDEAMPEHQRVHDKFRGWTTQSTIYWRSESLLEVEHGAEDVGLLEKDRRLFWVRLELEGGHDTLLVATVHLTYQGHPSERDTGHSPRVMQTRRVVSALSRLARANEPVVLTGDLNDPYLPMRMLLDAGYPNCFAQLGIPTEPTHPSYPTAGVAPRHAAQTIDWIVANQRARAVAAQVPHFYVGDVAPSDHWPVLAVYEIS